MDCVPAYTTGALFTSLILIDLFQRDWRSIPAKFLFGAIAVLVMTYVCQSYGPALGWILLGIPTFVLVLGLFFIWSDSAKEVKPIPAQLSTCGCPCCHAKPCRCKRRCSKPTPPAC
jgi:hypothetical protein